MVPAPGPVDDHAAGRGLALASGAVAAVLVAVMVVSFTPRRSSAPVALSATTLPAAQLRNVAADPSAPDDDGGPPAEVQAFVPATVVPSVHMVKVARRTVTLSGDLALSGAPIAISAARVASIPEIAAESPRPEEWVVLLTSTHAFDVTWGDVDQLVAPDGSIVTNRAGELLGRFADGQLTVLVP